MLSLDERGADGISIADRLGETNSLSTVGSARRGLEVAQELLAETQGAILPLVPYLDALRWVFIVIALAGVAVAICARLDDWKNGRR